MSNRTKPNELAVLTVNGQKYEEWESVLVKHEERADVPYRFRFTCSEGMPLAQNWNKLQIKPGMQCSVTLAGILAITGTVNSRQVLYNARRHYIEIQGGTLTETAQASVVTKTGEFNNSTPEQIMRSVLKPLGKKLVIEGGQMPAIKIPRVSVMPGIPVFDFLDELVRHVQTASGKAVSFTSNPQGDFVAIVGKAQPSGDAVVEGRNIIEARAIVYNRNIIGSGPSMGQRPGTNQVNGAKAAQPIVGNMIKGLVAGLPLSAIGICEIPAWDQKTLQGRASSENSWLSDDEITVFATVYGWLRPSGGLWYRSQEVSVTSPMLIMDNEKLRAKSVTFTQDNQTGTRTTLELCNENAFSLGPSMGGQTSGDGGDGATAATPGQKGIGHA
jgi:prophage tail gpP-like protein